MPKITPFPQANPQKIKAIALSDVPERTPTYAHAAGVDLVIVCVNKEVSVLYGRCLHRGALMADASLEGENLICGLHGWDYRWQSGVSAYNPAERLQKFSSWVSEEENAIYVDEAQIKAWLQDNPQAYNRQAYQGAYEDFHGTPEEPFNRYIRDLAANGLTGGEHGQVSAMGEPITNLPLWHDIQLLTAQLAVSPRPDNSPVATAVVIGPNAKKPLHLSIPLFVSDMSYGALSEEAKVALSKGAELAGTGICSGEGGMLEEEKAENARYFYEMASARFGWKLDKAASCQAFHFKAGQGAKTGTGGHLPGNKVKGKIAQVRGLPEGQAAVSPATFAHLNTPADYQKVADEVREASGGIPIGFKLSAQHIEVDLDFALAASADYIILDGRGGGTGAAPIIFKDNISVPTIAALARARRHLQRIRREDVSLIITGGLRTESDFIKALALGADAIALSNSALQAIGCLGMRACHTNNCPVGIATQKKNLRARLIVDQAAQRLARYFGATVDLMKILTRACGHESFAQLSPYDLSTWNRDMAHLTGIAYAGVSPR